jgi:hypothetical protein
MTKSATIAAFAAGLLCCASAGEALAQDCDAQIARVESRYGLGAQAAPAVEPAIPPAASGSHALTDAERHAQSGGVLTPPDIGAPVAAAPTGTSLAPSAIIRPSARDTAGLGAAERQRMSALLDAARVASRRGDMAGCIDQVRAAEAVPGVSGARRAD